MTDDIVARLRVERDEARHNNGVNWPMEIDRRNRMLAAAEARVEAMDRALKQGVGSALNELIARNLPREWSPQSGIGVMLAALGITDTSFSNAVAAALQSLPQGATSSLPPSASICRACGHRTYSSGGCPVCDCDVDAGVDPDWKQDQAETSRLPRKARREANSSSDGEVESRHLVNDGRNGETPARTSEDRLEAVEPASLLPLPGQHEGRSQKGEANVDRKPLVESTAGVAPGPSEAIRNAALADPIREVLENLRDSLSRFLLHCKDTHGLSYDSQEQLFNSAASQAEFCIEEINAALQTEQREPGVAGYWPADDEIWDCIRLTVDQKTAERLSFKRWKDGIDINIPTAEAVSLAKQFFAMGLVAAAPQSSPAAGGE